MGSFTRLVEQVRKGDEQATTDLANHFLDTALVLARLSLPTSPTSSADYEDIANSALKSFFVRLRDGRLEYYGDRQLVSALRKIVKAKTNRLFEIHLSDKRDVRKLAGNQSIDCLTQGSFNQVSALTLIGEYLELETSEADQQAVERILDSLQQELHGLFKTLAAALDKYPRQVLFLMLEADLSNLQIAERLGRSVASIERYRKLIREKLEGLRQ